MDMIKLIAAVPPLLVWFALWFYLRKIDLQQREIRERLDSSDLFREV